MDDISKGCIPNDFAGDGRWMSMHTRFKLEAFNSKNCDVLLIGDSIVHQMQFTKFYNNCLPKGRTILNFGIGGDKVENVLWRIQDGDWLANIKTKVAVLFVGTNNINSSPEEILNLLVAVTEKIHEKSPLTHIILPMLLPRGQFPNILREKNYQTNSLIKQKFCEKRLFSVIDMEQDTKIIDINGLISHDILHDYLHLTDRGYSITWKNVFSECENILKNEEENQNDK